MGYWQKYGKARNSWQKGVRGRPIAGQRLPRLTVRPARRQVRF